MTEVKNEPEASEEETVALRQTTPTSSEESSLEICSTAASVESEKKELKEVQKDISAKTTVYFALIAISVSFWSGMDTAAGPQIMDAYKYDGNYTQKLGEITESRESLFMSLPHYGIGLGIPLCGIFIDMVGRRSGLLVSLVLLLISFLLMGAEYDWHSILVGRFFGGLGDGFAFTVTAVYLAEITLIRLRAQLQAGNTAMINVSWNLAILVFKFLGIKISLFAIACGIVVTLILLCFMAIETPYFLLTKGKEEESEKTMLRIRGPGYDHKTEMGEIREMMSKKLTWLEYVKKLGSRHSLMVLFCSVTMMFVQSFSGVDIVPYYIFSHTPYLVGKEPPFGQATSEEVYIAFAIQLGFMVGYLVSMVFVKRWKRKTVFISVASFHALFTFILGGFFYALEHKYLTINEPLKYIIIVVLFACMFCYGAGIGPIGYTIITELAPAETKGFLTSVPMAVRFLFIGVQNLIYPSVMDAVGVGIPFFFFGVILLLGIAFNYFFIPETKDLSPQQLENIFDKPRTAKAKSNYQV